ncbi:hypothetical protein GKC30_14450 [Pseudodesulfovibrio sp. F-1]|uniref:YcaO domain-containing protein n=1 Tax=Pseudodesulfovibrio alkaliphilus TaxID=2661613 RepID=A0A7K1KRY3_9BACT|nr:YcaO-like family protein [Pseudodesulfovibrio alkaliphilus]MUM78834.1 hypothetical protein [Pseudodesulfovibrio alkaliphilus]
MTSSTHHPRNIPLSRILPQLVSRKTGILKGLNTLLNSPGEPKTHVAISELTDSRRYLDCYGETSGTGVGLTEDRALMSALGEAVEGYCAYDIRNPLIMGSYRKISTIDPHAVSPAELPLYSPSQYGNEKFKYRPFTEDTVIRWTKGKSAITGTQRHLPAALVYVSYSVCEKETPLCHTIFGGIASSTSHTSALLSGLYEAVERDAMMIWWLGQLSCAKVELTSDTWVGKLFEQKFAGSGLTFELWHITMDIPIPVFFGLVTDARNNTVAGGFGTNLNPEVAALKALFECVQNRLGQLPMKSDWGRSLYNEKTQKNIFDENSDTIAQQNFSGMVDLNNNLHTYLQPETHHYLDAVRSGNNTIDLNEIRNRSNGSAEQDTETCLELLHKQGFDVIVTDLTHEDVADLGFMVLRVSIPGLVPNSVTAWPHLGNQRLYDVPPKLGFKRKAEAEMADYPLPYA